MAHQLQQRGVVEDGDPLSVQQIVDVVITFAVECGEKVDEQAQRQRPDERPHVDLLDFAHLLLNPAGDAQKIDGDEAAEGAEDDVEGDVADREALGRADGEHHVVAEEEHRHHRAGGGGEQQGQERAAGEVEHQHLEGEDQRGDGGLEDGGHRGRGTAGQQQGGLPSVEVEEPRHVRTDGAAGEHNRRLQSHRTAKPDGDGTCHHGGIDVVEPQLAVALADGLQHDAYTVAEVVTHHAPYEQKREKNADGRKNQVEIVDVRHRECLAQQPGGEVKQVLDDDGCGCPEKAD